MISILYVDDEKMLLDIGKLFLERSGDCSVDVAISAHKGIEQIGKKTYDAIVSDYQMPEMDGIEFLKKIRSMSNIPFILFTGKGREEVVIEAINRGADFYLQKGGDPKSQFVELKHKIVQAVNRRRIEEELKKSETKYRQLVDLLPQTVFEIDQNFMITAINTVALNTFGYTREDLEQGVNVFEVFVDEDNLRMKENIQKIYQGFPIGGVEYTAKRKDGTTFPVITYSAPVIYDNNPVGLRGVLVDITERKAAEQATLQALSLLKATVESTADGLLVISREGKIVNYNQKFARMWHIPRSILEMGDDATAINHVLNQLIEPDEFLSKVLDLYNRPLDFSFDVLRFKDGRIFERYSQPQMLKDEVVGRVWSFRDITDRKQAEDALKQSEIRYRTIFENTGTAMVILEEDTTVGFANNEFFRLTGYSQDDIDDRKSWTEFVHSGDLEYMIQQHRLRREKSGEALRQYEFRLLTKSGEIRNILLTIDMFPGTRRSIASLIDIADRKICGRGSPRN
jgi:PAS domain S-box-containing protein